MNVKNSVLAVPVHFNNAQTQATKDAGVIAGLIVVQIINEPVAASIGYGLEKKYKSDDDVKNFLVFHLGGVTSDMTILAIHDGYYKVLASTGDEYLGGDVFYHKIMKYYINLIKINHGKDISKDNRALIS
ncbi:hypothetical protein POM88_020076 [Heracleum sosnowskyi]|uniref:Heat shock protein 70 n=1 Tax=Heracleum sosnowskyi TaxID=360622 RepID=A0AAD8IB70_9APIA|nr:hypothetical protein POM88_020076 [Heracleum sosnowskyi]